MSAQEYQITAVSGETRDFSTRFGTMRSYKLKLRGIEGPVEISQKLETPAPVEGQTLTGNIEQGKFGPKFKKEYNQSGFGESAPTTSPTPATGSTGSSKSYGNYEKKDDQFTFYLSYAKDAALALVAQGTLPTEAMWDKTYGDLLETILTGGKTLFNDRPTGDK